MRIAIDARCLTGAYTGDRTYWLGLVRGLCKLEHEHEILLYTHTPIADPSLPADDRLRQRVIAARNLRWWSWKLFPDAAHADGANVAHVQYTVSPRLRMPVVTTVHDISFRLMPRCFPPKHRLLLNLTVPLAMRRAARIITVSESSRQDILRVYRLPGEKVVAIPNAVDEQMRPIEREKAEEALRLHYALQAPFVLMVGVLQPRKNLPLAVQAFAQVVTAANLPHRLVIVGKAGWGMEELRRAIARWKIQERTLLTGYVPDEHLPAFYSVADALMYPSLYEGFGLPPLEAMACGCPVLASDIPVMREVVGEAGMLLSATDPVVWAQALHTVLTNEWVRGQMRQRGFQQAVRFSWTQTARRTVEVYEAVAH
ncbi:MAG: glycosyltransferase family 1 protein [Armatimonadota bacterium]|nr:glycosyltransferase family 4 protein [bacterium]MDW8321516.1 glycosyltransferase family 1 protein [Armatimonadota bacterium]